MKYIQGNTLKNDVNVIEILSINEEMRQLEARKITWPMWDAYYIERDKWCPLMFFTKQEVADTYWMSLLNILDTKWEYKSPAIPNNQLYIVFNEDETTT